jgi:hypothetical protein
MRFYLMYITLEFQLTNENLTSKFNITNNDTGFVEKQAVLKSRVLSK